MSLLLHDHEHPRLHGGPNQARLQLDRGGTWTCPLGPLGGHGTCRHNQQQSREDLQHPCLEHVQDVYVDRFLGQGHVHGAPELSDSVDHFFCSRTRAKTNDVEGRRAYMADGEGLDNVRPFHHLHDGEIHNVRRQMPRCKILLSWGYWTRWSFFPV